jgi:hypothetical protein
MTSEYETEPVPGLPENLPAGERMLWQGAPRWQGLALGAFRVRAVAIYFGLLMLWRLASGMYDGASPLAAIASALWLVPFALGAIGMLVLLAWLSARSTIYTITDRRLVLRFGVALPMSVNLPFRLIDSAGLKARGDGSGDIVLTLRRGERVGYTILWPHVRPWHLTRPQPMLRALPDAAGAAQVLSRALAASAGVSAPPIGERAPAPMQPAPQPLAAAAS